MRWPSRARGARSSRGDRRVPAFEQLAMDLGPECPRWVLSRPARESPHRERMLRRLEFVRRFFPELDGCTIRVGLARKPGILGWGSLDPEQPGIWVRPRGTDYFTVAHELTHLLQARGLVPGGERACDLFALARSPMLADTPPGYLRLPRDLRDLRRLEPLQATFLCEAARAALRARDEGDRRYLKRFEQAVADAAREGRLPRSAGPLRTESVRPQRLALETGGTS